MTHLGLETKVMAKRRAMSQIGSLTPTIKSQKSPLFLRCKWHDTYHSKALNKDYNFASDLTSIEGLHTKL